MEKKYFDASTIDVVLMYKGLKLFQNKSLKLDFFHSAQHLTKIPRDTTGV